MVKASNNRELVREIPWKMWQLYDDANDRKVSATQISKWKFSGNEDGNCKEGNSVELGAFITGANEQWIEAQWSVGKRGGQKDYLASFWINSIYSVWNKKPLKGFKQESGILWYNFKLLLLTDLQGDVRLDVTGSIHGAVRMYI